MRGVLVLVAGVSGTGKTTLCREIVKNWHLPEPVSHLGKDETLEEYARMKGTTAREILKNYKKEREFVYEMYYSLAEKELKKGKLVLLDNPHVKELLYYPEWRKRINSMIGRTKSKLVFIKCLVPNEKACRKRLEVRNLERDREKLRTSKTFRQFLEYEPLDFPPPKGSLVLDTSKRIDIQKVIEFIGKSKGIKL